MQFAQFHIAVTSTQIRAQQRAPHIHSRESIACITVHSIQALLRINKCMRQMSSGKYCDMPKYTLVTATSMTMCSCGHGQAWVAKILPLCFRYQALSAL
jgi:hypothetical protein